MSRQYIDFGAPFDFPDGDLFIRSADGTYFRAHKLFLSTASATIREFQYDISAAQEDKRDGLPVLHFAGPGEDKVVLEHFLRLVYPVAPPTFTTFLEIRRVLEFCHKYQADMVIALVGEMLPSHPLLRTEPFGFYALGCAYRLENLARTAAEECLEPHHLKILENPQRSKDAALMGGIDLFRFLDFQRRRKEALLAAVSDNGLQKLLAEKNGPRYAKAWVWMQPYDHAASDACCGFAPYHFWTNGRIGVWFLDYIAACREALRDTPSHHVITKPALVGAAIAKASTCAHYPAQTAINELDEFIGRLQASMKSNVAQIKLEW